MRENSSARVAVDAEFAVSFHVVAVSRKWHWDYGTFLNSYIRINLVQEG
jgi:hypothetical protein